MAVMDTPVKCWERRVAFIVKKLQLKICSYLAACLTVGKDDGN